jgi:hypothetical protein
METASAGERGPEYFGAGANARRNKEGDEHQQFLGGRQDGEVLFIQARHEAGTDG